MDVVLVKKYLCVICGKTEITERMTEHTYEGEVPDQGNCDFSRYSGHQIIGGKLLKNRPRQRWMAVQLLQLRNNLREPEITNPTGGICDNCLREKDISTLAKGDHINFAKPEDFKNLSRWD